ncbi:MAG: FG-GAP repeat protein [Gammaproteobacteria bacterium]|nr:FG-GAP repeat protein [Gammaproteobacteria bacterium]
MNPSLSRSNWPAIVLMSLGLFLVACSESGNNPSNNTSDNTTAGTTDDATEDAIGDATELALELVADKTFRITWEPRDGAQSYRVFENPDGVTGYSPISEALEPSTHLFDHRIALYLRINASYLVETCYASGCVSSDAAFVTGTLDEAVGYIKASNAEGGYLSPGQQESPFIVGGDRFGSAISLSDDGKTLAVSAPGEDSAAMGVDGIQDDNADMDTGAVYVFVRDDERWQQQAYLKADNHERICCLGSTSLSLSGDGDTLAVGTNGVNRYTIEVFTGEVYIFTRTNGVWQQQASVQPGFLTDAQGNTYDKYFGWSVSLNYDGDKLVVGAPDEGSAATGVNGNQDDDSVNGAGAAYVFDRTAGEWQEQAYLKASNTGARFAFGYSVVISADGSTIVVGAVGEASIASGILGRPTSEEVIQDFSNDKAGAAYVFVRSGDSWQQEAFIKASDPEEDDRFGGAIALSADGNTLAVAASGDDGYTGAVYVFARNSGKWVQQAYLNASNKDLARFAQFGSAISISADGNTLAIGAWGEGGFSNGINGDQYAVLPKPSYGRPEGAIYIGAAYVFTRNVSEWRQVAYVKATNNTADVENISVSYGEALALSGDGQTLVVGTNEEAGGTNQINGDRFDSSAPGAGAVFVY